MKTFPFLAGVALLLNLAPCLWADGPSERAQIWSRQVAPLMAKYCVDCHRGDKAEAELDLSRYRTPDQIGGDRKVWLKVLGKLRSEEMPPEEAESRPSKEERAVLVDWIDAVLNDIDCSQVNPGRVTIRRLNRIEYRNTIRDLLAVDYAPAEDFPGDDVGYGFDNIGDVLSLPPILLEKYLAAADDITGRAFVLDGLEPRVLPKTVARELRAGNNSGEHGDDRALASTGEVATHVDVPQDGIYRVRVFAYGQQAGDEPTKMEFRVDGKKVDVADVNATEDKPQRYDWKGRLKAGKRTIGVAFINDYYRPEDPDPKNRDRNLYIQSMEILGPEGVQRRDLPESRQRVFFIRPGDGVEPKEAARRVLERLASRAYRRPATSAEIDRLVALAETARRAGENFETSICLAVQAVLVSPHFLFEVELDPAGSDKIRSLNDYELATRLSYFLWSSMPDLELFRLAHEGQLNRPDVLEQQVRRMLADPKSQALIDNFASQWLELRKLDEISPDPKRFPSFNEKLRQAMRRETETFFGAVLREDRPVLELLFSDYTFVNESLARHYGIAGVSGDEFQRVSLKGTTRGGLLTQASILTATSNPTRTSPVKRGKWVLENLLGEPPPAPPPNVPELKEGEQAELQGTLRQRMEQHRTNPTCASCHRRMDELGFALENFDAIGGWREKDGNSPIDAAGELPTGEKFQNSQDLLRLLANHRQQAFARCLTEKMLTYALGRGLEYYDKCAVDKILDGMTKNEYRMSTLILGIVRSEPFQKRSAQRSQP